MHSTDAVPFTFSLGLSTTLIDAACDGSSYIRLQTKLAVLKLRVSLLLNTRLGFSIQSASMCDVNWCL